MIFAGLSPDGRLVEIAELAGHPFMLGSQFHPEFKSRPNKPHPLFLAFVQAAIAHREQRLRSSRGATLKATVDHRRGTRIHRGPASEE